MDKGKKLELLNKFNLSRQQREILTGLLNAENKKSDGDEQNVNKGKAIFSISASKDNISFTLIAGSPIVISEGDGAGEMVVSTISADFVRGAIIESVGAYCSGAVVNFSARALLFIDFIMSSGDCIAEKSMSAFISIDKFNEFANAKLNDTIYIPIENIIYDTVRYGETCKLLANNKNFPEGTEIYSDVLYSLKISYSDNGIEYVGKVYSIDRTNKFIYFDIKGERWKYSFKVKTNDGITKHNSYITDITFVEVVSN